MKVNKWVKSILAFVLMCIFLFSIPMTSVYAASHTGHYKLNPLVSMGKKRTNVHWWYSQEGSHYYGYRIMLGTYAWRDAFGTDAGFSKVSNKKEADIRIYSNDYGNTGWIGQHTPCFGYGNIKLNDHYHNSNGGYSRYEEVFSHEMGHAFGLLHYNCNKELMRSQGYIGTPNPQKGDIAGYKAKYKLK